MNRNPRGSKIKFKKLVSLPRYYFFLLKAISRQKKFIAKELQPELDKFRNANDGSLTPEDLNKITSYYALGVPGILGEAFAVLRGNSIQLNERFALTYLGGISGLLDDLFDNPKKDAISLKPLIAAPENSAPTNTYNSLLLHLYNMGLCEATNPEILKIRAKEVYSAQENSLKQHEINSLEFLKMITWEKGGASFIFYRSCLNNSLEEPEKEFVYHLGGLMQLGNDIFDVYEDFHSGIKTIATLTTDIRILRELFFTEFERAYFLAYKTRFKKSDIMPFLNLSGLALSRIFVCLDQFEELQNSTEGIFSLANYQRKQLICDMQKTSNQLKAIKYYLQFQTLYEN